jgi:hypothetical protein
MPRRKAYSYWSARARKLADKELDEHIAPAEVAECANEVYGDLYSLVCSGADAYFQTTYAFTATGAVSYDEPDNHLSTVMLERVESSGGRYPLTKLLAQERHLFGGLTSSSCASAYSLIDDQIFLYPKPSSGDFELLYIPQPPDLTTYLDTDKIDVVNVYGEQFFMYGVAALIKSKSEDDVRFFLSRQERAEEKLVEWAAQRSFHDGQHMFSDVGADE